MEKTAVIYVRVSTARQADGELPIQSQVDQCQAKAEKLGAEVVRIFRDEGISGRSDSRPAFQDAISYCELYAPDFFITWSTSRFARNKVDAGWYKRRLQKCGTALTYVSVDIDTSSDEGWILDSIFEFTDELYSRQVARDTTRSMIKNARDGFWNGGTAPYGFKSAPAAENPKRRRLYQVKDEAAAVKEIFSLRLDGSGIRSIAKRLNNRGSTARGKKWSATAVLNVLRSEAAIGNVVFGRRGPASMGKRIRPREEWTIVPSHEPIIDQQTWASVQKLLDDDSPASVSSSGSPLSRHLFTGILKCNQCGASLQIETAKGRSRRYSYYNCRNAQRTGSCESRRIPADRVDAWLLREIIDVVFNDDNLRDIVDDINAVVGEWATDRAARKEAVIEKIEEVSTKNHKLYEVLELMGKDAPNLADLTRRLRKNNAETKKLEEQLASIECEEPPQVLVSHDGLQEVRDALVTVAETTDNPKKLRGFFGSFINGIYFDGEVARIEYRPSVLVNRAVHSTIKWLPSADSNHGPGD